MRFLKHLIIVGIFFSCAKKEGKLPPINNEVDLDGTLIVDSSLIKPEDFLLSSAIPSPSQADLAKQVVITAHGFSATNFEWQEFASWAKGKPDLLVSRVLLGGHGRDYRSFQRSDWKEWQKPVIDEYNRLRDLGYQKISFAGSSTGCTLLLDMLYEKKINAGVLKHIYFIDPLIIPSNKTLPLIPAIGGILVEYTETTMEQGENGYWYKYRPQQALRQLNQLSGHCRKQLEKGIALPDGVHLKVYKAEKDGSADPLGAVLIQKGVKGSEVVMVSTGLHVFTRLKGRNEISVADKELQQKTFEEIYQDLQR